MVLSLPFILAFIGSAVGLILGMLIFGEVSDAISCPASGGGQEATGWDISTSVFLQSFSLAGQDLNPLGIFFRDDGLKMYVSGSTLDTILEYDLSTASDVSSSVFLQSFSVAGEDDQLQDVFFKSDGLKMYFVGNNNNSIFEYNLSTAWDVSTSVFLQSFSVAVQDTAPRGVFFRDDGLKMYVVASGNRKVFEYDLSNAWDISTASFLQSFSVVAQDTSPRGVFFRDDGLKMYVQGLTNDGVYEYDLSTAWDVSSSVFLQSFFVVDDNQPFDVFFRDDGLKMYVIGFDNSSIFEYDLQSTGGGGGGGPAEVGSEQCQQAKDISWTVIGIIPVALFFSLFAIFSALGTGRQG